MFFSEYSDLKSLGKGLLDNEVEGILLDAFTTSYSFNKVWEYGDEFEKVKILDFPFFVGFYLALPFVNENVGLKTCTVRRTQELVDSKIYKMALDYIQNPNLKVSGFKNNIHHYILIYSPKKK